MNALLFERETDTAAEWRECTKNALRFVELADGHYTRQTPGSIHVLRPGMNLPLVLADGSAAWNVWRPIPQIGRKDFLEAWECTLFRYVGGGRLSSDLIIAATDRTWRKWGWPPRDGLITSVGIEQTAAHRSPWHEPGWCFRKAGWTEFEHPYADASKMWLRAPHPRREEPE